MANRDLTAQERDALEALVDASNLTAVVQALSEICDAKAEHIRANWQEDALARAWAWACGTLGIASVNIGRKLSI
jgi:hypothetical protein